MTESSSSSQRCDLSPEALRVLKGKGTEAPFTGAYWNLHEDGLYHCGLCGAPLFDSKDKFDSGTGWPSFTRPAESQAVKEEVDRSYGMERTEIVCRHCGGHLGHVFPDGPQPTGQRFCINSAALKFSKR